MGALFEEVLQPGERNSIIFSWTGCPAVPELYFRLYGVGLDQKVELIIENARPQCLENRGIGVSQIYPARLMNDGYWFQVITVTPLPS
jgi:hypothetical protein